MQIKSASNRNVVVEMPCLREDTMSISPSSVPVWKKRIKIRRFRDSWTANLAGRADRFPLLGEGKLPTPEEVITELRKSLKSGGFNNFRLELAKERLSYSRFKLFMLPEFKYMEQENEDEKFGWRLWTWWKAKKMLLSPYTFTEWTDSIMMAENWSEWQDAGIHAYHLWFYPKEKDISMVKNSGYIIGIVERIQGYGAVIGSLGWRAEAVAIRKLWVPKKIIDDIKETYPNVEVFSLHL